MFFSESLTNVSGENHIGSCMRVVELSRVEARVGNRVRSYVAESFRIACQKQRRKKVPHPVLRENYTND